MKKNEKTSKKVADLMKKLTTDELNATTGAGLAKPCYFCGLVQTNI